MTTEHVTTTPPPADDGERFVRDLLRRPGHDEPEPEPAPQEPTPPRIPAGAHQEPARRPSVDAWLRALHHELKTGQPIDPSRFE